jgi:hypothetical protein
MDAPRHTRRPSQSGYALLMALCLVLLMIVASQVVLQNLATQGRRQREDEMIWRGRQYVRAIRLYYHKTGHYPQTVEDLQKGLPELHFLRLAAYQDPMNLPDGAWRLIYVNAAGQIIGSVKYATLQQMALMDMNGGQLPAATGGAQPGAPAGGAATGTGNTAQGTQPGPGTSAQGGPGGGTDNAPGASQNPPSGPGAAPGQPAAGPVPGQPQPTGPVDGPVLGAFLTGVGGGSKADKPSVKVYHGGKKYGDWEFIWNPLEDQARAVQAGISPQGAQPGQPGQPIGPGGIGMGGIGTGPGPGGPGGPSGPGGAPAPQFAPFQAPRQ